MGYLKQLSARALGEESRSDFISQVGSVTGKPWYLGVNGCLRTPKGYSRPDRAPMLVRCYFQLTDRTIAFFHCVTRIFVALLHAKS